ncbi:MAG: hypothetical protein ACJATI_001732 [Halioglobus sp.]|jgi:hypothetical protein
MTKGLFKIFGISLILYFSINIAVPYNTFLRNRSIENQINYINRILSEGYDDELQDRYPEGKVFSNAIFALSVIEYSNRSKKFKKQYSRILDQRVEVLISESTTVSFVEDMIPRFGAFYNGWVNLVLKKYINSGLFELSDSQSEIKSAHKQLSNALIKPQFDSIRVLDTYPGSYWPADNLVGILSLENKLIQELWLNKVICASETESKLINHVGYSPSEIRGSSQALIVYLLSKYDFQYALECNKVFAGLLTKTYLNVDLVKEFKDESSGYSDIDSGPIILGFGSVATVMNTKTQASLKNKRSRNTWAFLNTISVPINIANSKYYLFKKEPMLDIFMLWCSVEL